MVGEVQPPAHALRPIWSYASKAFLVSAGMILALTGIAKIWSAFGDGRLLGLADPIIGVKFRSLMLAAGLIEMAIAFVCFLSSERATKYLLLAWLATVLAAYRIAIWYVGWRLPCSCLGNITDALHISPQVADGVMKGVLAYLGIGAYLLYVVHWTQNRRMQAAHIPQAC